MANYKWAQHSARGTDRTNWTARAICTSLGHSASAPVLDTEVYQQQLEMSKQDDATEDAEVPLPSG